MVRRYCVAALLLLCAACQDPHFGAGPITLSPGVKASFEEYMARDAPLYFAVTPNGNGSFYVYCEGGFNCTSSAAQMETLDECRSHNFGQDCKLYAIGRSVVWQGAEGSATASKRDTRIAAAGAQPERATGSRLPLGPYAFDPGRQVFAGDRVPGADRARQARPLLRARARP
jgi:hypothetical protein